jgi:hypothetical protein
VAKHKQFGGQHGQLIDRCRKLLHLFWVYLRAHESTGGWSGMFDLAVASAVKLVGATLHLHSTKAGTRLWRAGSAAGPGTGQHPRDAFCVPVVYRTFKG